MSQFGRDDPAYGMNRNSSYNLGRPEMATAAQRSVSPAVLDRLAQPQAASEPVDRNDAGESYVFRDFERSKITTMRLAIDRAPLRYSLICAAMTLFWTVIMSAGAGLNGSNGIVLNLTPNAHTGYRVGLPVAGVWKELLNSDAAIYGGSNVGNPLGVTAEDFSVHNQRYSAMFTLPPMSVSVFGPA